jgi:hypothetical protein
LTVSKSFTSNINDFGVITGGSSQGNIAFGYLRVPVSDERFRPGTFDVSDEDGRRIDGGFYLYGDPTVGCGLLLAAINLHLFPWLAE